MQGDLTVSRNAAKGIVVAPEEFSDLLNAVEQKLSDANNPAKQEAPVEPVKEKNKPQLVSFNKDQLVAKPKPLPVPLPGPQEAKAGLDALPSKVTAEGILSESAKAAEEDRKKLEEEQKLAQQKRQREQEEKKRQEALQKAEMDRRQREEAKRKRDEQQRQIILQEERRRILAQQKAERERVAREEQQRRMFEEAERQRVEKENQKEQQKEQERQAEIARQREQEEAERAKEEQMRKEMERLQRQERTLPVVLRELKKRIRVHKAELEKELLSLASKEAPLNDTRSQLEEKVSIISDSEYKEALATEQEIESKEEEFLKSGKHKQADLEQEKILSQRLWEIEDRRKLAEKARWEIEDRIKKIKTQIQEINSEIVSLTSNKAHIHEQIKTLIAQEKLVDFAEWKKGVEEEILAVQAERDALSPVLERASSEKTAAQAAFDQLSEREREIGDNLKTAETKEKESQDPELRRVAEKSRWDIGNELRKTTQEKWECEKQLSDAITFEKEQQSKIDKVSARLNSLEDKISAQEVVLVKADISPKRLRDQIAGFLAENELEVDPTLLNDITQIDEAEAAPVDASGGKQPDAVAIPQAASQQEVAKSAVNEPPIDDNKPDAGVRVEEIKPAETKPQAEAQPVAAQPAQSEPQPEPQPVPAAKMPEPEVRPEPLTQPVVQIAQADMSVPKEQKKEPVTVPVVSAQTFREPIDEQPAAPVNVPVFPDQPASQETDTGGEGNEVVIGGEAAPTGVPEAIGNVAQGFEEEPQPESEASLENRWTEIANANDAVVAKGVETSPAFTDAQPIKVPRRSKNSQKVVVQILVALFILIVIGGAGTFILLTKMNQTTSTVPVKTTVKKTTSTPQPKQNPTNTNGSTQTPVQTQSTPGGAPQSLISTISNISIITDNLDSVPSLISPYLTTNRDTDGYYRLLIQNKTDNTYVGLRQLFDIFKIKAPANLLNNLNDNATIFLYSNRGQNRFGFIASTTNAAGVAQIMKGWENTMEQDTDGLFKFLGKQQPSKQPGNFQNGVSSDQQITYRYIFFQPESANLGISYATYRNYFIFTSSVDSLTQIISQLPQ